MKQLRDSKGRFAKKQNQKGDKNMIEIQTEKIVTSKGVEARKIIKISALTINDLPTAYLETPGPCVYMTMAGNLKSDSWRAHGLNSVYGNMFVGDIIPEEPFQKKLKTIHAAGERLKKVNEMLREKRAAWNGTETFCI
jgi:hypothetical protein